MFNMKRFLHLMLAVVMLLTGVKDNGRAVR